MSVEITHLTKIFGTQKAVNDISFTAVEGQILGFLGPNGAGKSTTMKIVATCLPPTTGEVRVDGFDVTTHPLQVKRIVGYLPEHNPMYQDMYVHEYLAFITSLHKIRGRFGRKRIEKMIELTGLKKEQHKKIEALSKGYRQRVGIAQALIHDPKVMILDEPTTGLDPNQIIEIRNLIREISSNKTVILSTHIMQEVQALCDHVVIIDQGRIVADDKVENLKDLQTDHVRILIEFSNQIDWEIIKSIEGVIDVNITGNNKFEITADKSKDIRSEIFAIASRKGWPLVGLSLEEITIEKIFQSLTNRDKE